MSRHALAGPVGTTESALGRCSVVALKLSTLALIAATLAGCAASEDEPEWVPVPVQERAIVFTPAEFEVNESIYAATQFDFNTFYEYGVWRSPGGRERVVSVDLMRLRSDGGSIFTTQGPSMAESVLDRHGEDVLLTGESGTLDARLGPFDFQRYSNGGRQCAALRWFGWKSDDWRGIRGGGRQLGTARLRATLCEGDTPMEMSRISAFANALSARPIRGEGVPSSPAEREQERFVCSPSDRMC